ncbi:hypothetical protein EG329_003444 [Mollisiaceae sp. DMI_Dod_QoI]|nr:hypothetical protein EG329_003444 [Helotiales sp. DMI_Dod_QoI]
MVYKSNFLTLVSKISKPQSQYRQKAAKHQNLANLPPELLLEIARFLPTHAVALLTLCNKTILYKLGQTYTRKLIDQSPQSLNEEFAGYVRAPSQWSEYLIERMVFLSLLAKDLPKHDVCDICHKIHGPGRKHGVFTKSSPKGGDHLYCSALDKPYAYGSAYTFVNFQKLMTRYRSRKPTEWPTRRFKLPFGRESGPDFLTYIELRPRHGRLYTYADYQFYLSIPDSNLTAWLSGVIENQDKDWKFWICPHYQVEKYVLAGKLNDWIENALRLHPLFGYEQADHCKECETEFEICFVSQVKEGNEWIPEFPKYGHNSGEDITLLEDQKDENRERRVRVSVEVYKDFGRLEWKADPTFAAHFGYKCVPAGRARRLGRIKHNYLAHESVMLSMKKKEWREDIKTRAKQTFRAVLGERRGSVESLFLGPLPNSN